MRKQIYSFYIPAMFLYTIMLVVPAVAEDAPYEKPPEHVHANGGVNPVVPAHAHPGNEKGQLLRHQQLAQQGQASTNPHAAQQTSAATTQLVPVSTDLLTQFQQSQRRDPFCYEDKFAALSLAPPNTAYENQQLDPAYIDLETAHLPSGIHAVGFISIGDGKQMAVLEVPGYDKRFFVRENDVIRIEATTENGQEIYLHIRKIGNQCVHVCPSGRDDKETVIQ